MGGLGEGASVDSGRKEQRIAKFIAIVCNESARDGREENGGGGGGGGGSVAAAFKRRIAAPFLIRIAIKRDGKVLRHLSCTSVGAGRR